MALPTTAAFRAAFPELDYLPEAAITEALEASTEYYGGDVQRLQLLAAAHAHVVRRMVAEGAQLPKDLRGASSYGRQLRQGLRPMAAVV